jgi:methylenetetrahydrofolate reductase (NADPH)
LHERVFILVGVGPLRSVKAAEFMRRRVPGVWIPDTVIDRMAKTPPPRQTEEGKQICIEIIQQVREIEGVHGVHVMAYRQEEAVAEIIQRAGLFPRRASASLPATPPHEVLAPDIPTG